MEMLSSLKSWGLIIPILLQFIDIWSNKAIPVFGYFRNNIFIQVYGHYDAAASQ